MRVVRRKLPKAIPPVMVLAFLVTPILMNFVPVQSVQALSLKDTTQRLTEPLATLLGPVKQITTLPSASQPSSSPSASASSTTTQNPTPATPSASQQTPNSSASPIAQATPPSPVESTKPLETLQPIGSDTSSDGSTNARFTNAVLKNSAASSITTDFGWLQATENGWRVLGILWYWWLGIFGSMIAFITWRTRLRQMASSLTAASKTVR